MSTGPGLTVLIYADNATAAQLERIVRSFKGLHQPADAHAHRGLTVRQRGDGLTAFTLAVPDEVAGRMAVLVDRLVTELDDSGQPTDQQVAADADGGGDIPPVRPDPLSTRRADAVVHGLEVAVNHLDTDLTGAARTTLVLHGEVDSTLDLLARDSRDDRDGARGASAGASTAPDDASTSGCAHAWTAQADRPTTGASAAASARQVPSRDRIGVVTNGHGGMMAMSRRVLRQVACDPSLCWVTTRDGLPIDVGDTTRAISHGLRVALRIRDRACRFLGCGTTRHLHTHHIIHWADGGPTGTNTGYADRARARTDLDNLILLCGAHHRFVHANGWTITPDGTGRYAFHAPDADTAHPHRLAAVPTGQAASAAAAARHDPRGLEPPGYTGPDGTWTPALTSSTRNSPVCQP